MNLSKFSNNKNIIRTSLHSLPGHTDVGDIGSVLFSKKTETTPSQRLLSNFARVKLRQALKEIEAFIL
mgnify:CR=1 FL=1